jgi:hypothetical protein
VTKDYDDVKANKVSGSDIGYIAQSLRTFVSKSPTKQMSPHHRKRGQEELPIHSPKQSTGHIVKSYSESKKGTGNTSLLTLQLVYC